MPPKTIELTVEQAASIRARREERGLTIEAAARAGGVGSETWRRWEGGSAVRLDKLPGLLKVLRISTLDQLMESKAEGSRIDLRGDVAKLPASLRDLGEIAAVFMAGLEILSDSVNNDIEELATMPRGSHVGQLSISMLLEHLPDRWTTRYDHEFCWRLKSSLSGMRDRIRVMPEPVIARTPADDLIVRAALREGVMYYELGEQELPWAYRGDDDDEDDILDQRSLDEDLLADWLDDVEGLFLDGRDSPFVFFYTPFDPRPGDPLHIDNWFEGWNTPGRAVHLLNPHLTPEEAEKARIESIETFFDRSQTGKAAEESSDD